MTWRISDGRLDQLVVFQWRDGDWRPAGLLTFEGKNRSRFSRFMYAATWSKRNPVWPIDPHGLRARKNSFSSQPHEVPLAFYDAGPDGWGKMIFQAAYPQRTLGMAELLALGGFERTGDLAFGPTPDAPPQSWRPPESPLLTLPEQEETLEDLLIAADAVEDQQATPHHLGRLLRSSADIGGARPKARIRLDGRSWIAKFPTREDRFDHPRLEGVCLDLAAQAGLAVPDRCLIQVAGRAILLVDRFDRTPAGTPIGYLSAATLASQPPTAYRTEVSYADLAALAQRHLHIPTAAGELYRRLLINSFLHNTDDHLRNMAFLRQPPPEWVLAPAFDLVPCFEGRHACRPAPGITPAWAPTTAQTSYPAFKLTHPTARQIYDQVVAAMAHLPQALDRWQVSDRDRAITAPLLAACLNPPMWRDG